MMLTHIKRAIRSPVQWLACLLLVTGGIATAEQNVVVILDDSGSMADTLRSDRSMTRMVAAKAALTTVLQSLPEDAQVGVLALNSRVGGDPWIVPLGPIDRNLINRRINVVNADGGTPLGEAMEIGGDALIAARAKQIYGTYRLLIVTDGEASDERIVRQNLPQLTARGLTTDVIGVDMRGDHSLATRVTSYRRADDQASLQRAIAEVFAETSDDRGDAGQSDYEWLAGLPDEAASAVLLSLTKVDNRPIGEGRDRSIENEGQSTSPLQSPGPTNPAAPGGSGFSCCGFPFVLILLPIGFLLSRKFNSNNRR